MQDYPIHEDKGCSKAKESGYFGLCLECPFPECLEVKGISTKKQLRDTEILRLEKEGLSLKDIALQSGVTERTVYRVVRGR